MMKFKPQLRLIGRVAASTTILVTGLLAAGPLGADIVAGRMWNEASSARLQVMFPGDSYNASWQFQRCACGDILVNSDTTLPGDSRQGDMLLVQNRVVIYRGFDSDRPQDVMSIDAPALMMQLAFQLLERARPAGPFKVTGKEIIDIGSATEPVSLDSGQAVGSFFPPWSVNGRISPVRGDELQFELHFSFNATPPGAGAEQMASMDLTGSVDYVLKEFPVSDDRTLEELHLVWRDPDDPAIFGSDAATTLGELRAHIKANPF